MENFIERVIAILAETEYDPRRLELEITENTYIESQSIVNNLLYVLREKGIRFMIDDFGTGYSSLGYLKNISVNTIKIDKSFVFDLLEGKKNIEIIKTIILMAHGLGIDTIAEGIENEEQLQMLKSLNCRFGQGYYLSRPVNVAQIEAILNKQARMIINSGGLKEVSIYNAEL